MGKGTGNAQTALNNTSAAAKNLGNTGTALQNSTASTLQGMENSGYTPAEQASQQREAFGDVNNSFNAMQQNLLRRSAATGNSGSLGASTDRLAQERGQQVGNTAANLSTQNANARLANQKFATGQLAGMSMGDLETMAKLYGVNAEDLGNYVKAANTGFSSSLLSGLGGSLGGSLGQGAGQFLTS